MSYFFLKSGLADRVDLRLHKNPSLSKRPGSVAVDAEFWSRVAPERVAQAARAYKLDLEMLGYSASEYLASLGLPVPPGVVWDEQNPLIPKQ